MRDQPYLSPRTLILDVQYGENLANDFSIKKNLLKKAVLAGLAVAGHHHKTELSVRFVEADESKQLNHLYREKDYATNVLSFVADLDDVMANALHRHFLGDLVICLPIVIEEAQTQNKTFINHLMHLIVHGTLHLLGYDHEISEQGAEAMEALEVLALKRVGMKNPYL